MGNPASRRRPWPNPGQQPPSIQFLPTPGQQPLFSASSLLLSASFEGTSLYLAASVSSSPRRHYPQGWWRPNQASPFGGFSQTGPAHHLSYSAVTATALVFGVRLLGFSNLYREPWAPSKLRLVTVLSTGNTCLLFRNKASGAQRVNRLETKSPTPTPYSVP